ncbi:MAG: DUF4411 family protein [Methanosarcinaceae archaeon]|nr:DUF4411 family protein [Methanosarcinaceae archaeon]
MVDSSAFIQAHRTFYSHDIAPTFWKNYRNAPNKSL